MLAGRHPWPSIARGRSGWSPSVHRQKMLILPNSGRAEVGRKPIGKAMDLFTPVPAMQDKSVLCIRVCAVLRWLRGLWKDNTRCHIASNTPRMLEPYRDRQNGVIEMDTVSHIDVGNKGMVSSAVLISILFIDDVVAALAHIATADASICMPSRGLYSLDLQRDNVCWMGALTPLSVRHRIHKHAAVINDTAIDRTFVQAHDQWFLMMEAYH
ncbi:hypothetical protein V8C35DRAFT_285679 [Trichoderma chlorosporum]